MSNPTSARGGTSIEAVAYKDAWAINPDGTGAPWKCRVPVHVEPGAYWRGYIVDTYTEARDYAIRTTSAALTAAQQNSKAAWALPEHEPEETK